MGDPHPDCSCFRQSYNIGSRELGSLRLFVMSQGSPTPTYYGIHSSCLNTVLYRWIVVELSNFRLLQLGMGYGLRLTSGNNSTISEIISTSTESITISDTPVQTAVSVKSYDQSDMRYDKTLAQQWRCCDEKRQSNHNQLPTTILTLISLPFQMNKSRAGRRTSGVIIRHHGKQQSQ